MKKSMTLNEYMFWNKHLIGRKFIDDKCVIDKFVEEHKGIYTYEPVHTVIINTMKTIITKYNDEATTYGAYSKSTGICVIIKWGQTPYRQDGKNHAIIVTLPPVKKDFQSFYTANKKGIRFVVESLLFDSIKHKLTERVCRIPSFKKIKVNSLSIFLEDGKMFDSGVAYCFSVQ